MNNDLAYIIERIVEFNKERDWEQFHTPKNLAVSIAIESGELLENFQWSDDCYDEILSNKRLLGQIRDEIADILIYTLDLANNLRIDVGKAILDKLSKNRERYPVEKCKGSADKYNKL